MTAVPDFQIGRRWLDAIRPDLLVVNLHLGAYNGINLALLAPERTRSVVYTAYHDEGLARDVQSAGAFYELLVALPFVVPAYLEGRVPAHDRRNPTQYRNPRSRGPGRRVTDIEPIH